MYSDFEKAFDGAGSWSLGNGSVRNIAIFRVDKTLSSHTDNCKNNFLVSGKGQIKILMTALVQKMKILVLALVKQRQNGV